MATRLEKPIRDVFKECEFLYSTDTILFTGRDEQGSLVVLLEFERGKKRTAFQYAHKAIAYDQRTGWSKMLGNGRQRNLKRELIGIPSSEFYTFDGSPLEGMHIESAKNEFLLSIAPFQKTLALEVDASECWMGSAPASLEWKGRMTAGRVIYDSFFLVNYNGMLRRFRRKKRSRQVISLTVSRHGDLRFFRKNHPAYEKITGNLGGFGWLNNTKGTLQAMELRVRHTDSGMGFFRWPSAWEGAFVLGDTSYSFDLMLTERLVRRNSLTGGEAIGILQGTLQSKKGNADLFGIVDVEV